MPIMWQVLLGLFGVLGTILGALGGLSGLAAMRNARSEAKKVTHVVLTSTIATLHAENKRMSERIDDGDADNRMLRARVDELEVGAEAQTRQLAQQQVQIEQLQAENRSLRRKIADQQKRRDELELENRELREKNGPMET